MKRLRKEELSGVIKIVEEPVLGIREILRRNWKFLLILIIGIIGIYFNSLWGDFVSDDYATIPQNNELSKISWSAGFTPDLFKTSISWIFGNQNPIPYHIGCLIIYILVCVVAYVFLSLFFSSLVSRVALIIFAVLPVHVESVSWISGIPYLLTSLFVLSGLINFVLYLRTRKKKYLLCLFILSLLLIFTDRIRGFAIVLIAGLILASFPEKVKLKINLWVLISIVLGAFGILLVFGWPMIQTRIDSVNSGINTSESIFYNPLFQYPTAISKYLQLVLVPTDLTLYHTLYVSPDWLNWLVLLLYLSTIVWFYFKDKKYFFALAFVFAATAPSMAPVKVSWLVAERYVFLGSLGIALLFGLLAERYWQKRVLIIVLLSIVTGVYGARVFLRNIDWQTNHNLWVNTCQVSPNSHNAWNNIGDDYDKLAQAETIDEGKTKQYLNAIKGFGMSFQIKPNYADAYHNQANIFYKIGRLDLARQGYEQALVYNPNLYQTYLTLVQLDLMQNDKENLLRHLVGLNQSNPNDLQTVFLTANAYARIGMIDEAKQLATLMYQQLPDVVEIKNLYESLLPLNSSSSSSLSE